MADIILAEHNGNVWLVRGEEHIDDLLYNSLSAEITIEFVPCDTKSDIHRLWIQNCGEPGSAADPWIINPAIVKRIKRRNSPDYPVLFAQWSVNLDAEALDTIATAISDAAIRDEAPIVLADYLAADGPQMNADLSRLRRQLIEQKLIEGGVDRARIVHETRDAADIPGLGQESQRVDIVIRTS